MKNSNDTIGNKKGWTQQKMTADTLSTDNAADNKESRACYF